jgi:hypothetical protein
MKLVSTKKKSNHRTNIQNYLKKYPPQPSLEKRRACPEFSSGEFPASNLFIRNKKYYFKTRAWNSAAPCSSLSKREVGWDSFG